MSDDRSGRRARHDGEGRPASDILREWHTGEFAAISDEPTGPVTSGRRARRRALEEEARRRGAAADPLVPEDDATVRTPWCPAHPAPRPPAAPCRARRSPPSTGWSSAPPASGPRSAPTTTPTGTPGSPPPTSTRRPARSTPSPPTTSPPTSATTTGTTTTTTTDDHAVDEHDHHDDRHDEHHDDDLHDQHPPATGEHPVWDQTGGLEVIGADDDDHDGRRARRGRRDRGRTRGPRRKRRPVTIVLSLLVLAGLVVGIVFGGQWLYQKINPVAADYTGSGSGEVDVRVESGDSLTAIARTLQGADVIASTGRSSTPRRPTRPRPASSPASTRWPCR